MTEYAIQNMKLWPHQTAALESLAVGLAAGQNRLLWKIPTGGGKTIAFAEVLKWPSLQPWLDAWPKKGARLLVVAHREELLTQARAKIQAANPGLMVSIEQGDMVANRYSDVVIASIQTLSARKFTRLKRLLHYHAPQIVIVDEAHHAAAASYRTMLAYLGFLPMADATDKEGLVAATHDDVEVMTKALAGWDLVAPKDRLLLGVTATPNRTDAVGLGCVFNSIAYSYALKQAVEDGWLVPMVPWVVETTSSLDAVRTTAGDFNQKDLAGAVNNFERNRLALEAWHGYAEGLSTLGFTVDVAHAHDLAALFMAGGVSAAALSGDTPKDERRAMLAAYSGRDLAVIFNCMVLSEGTDLPLTGCILNTKPTKSATLYEQMVGRGLRIFPGKDACIIIDMVDVSRRHSLQAAPVLYGLPPGLVTKGKDLRKVTEDLEALRAKYPSLNIEEMLASGRMTLEQLGAKASTFDVWTVPTLGDLGAVVTLDWMRTATDTFRLQYPWQDGSETLSVQPDVLGHFDLSLTLRPPSGAIRQRTVASQVPTVVEALTLAEAFIRNERQSVMKLKDRDAPWKSRPASIKQIQLLRSRHIPHSPAKLTMGQASALIDLHNAKRGR